MALTLANILLPTNWYKDNPFIYYKNEIFATIDNQP